MRVSKPILFVVIAALLAGCGVTRYVPVETVRMDSIYVDRVQRDTLIRRDSIYVCDKGDTVTIYKERLVYRYRDRTDTLYRERIDTLRVPYPVEKELTKWQSLKIEAGGFAMAAALVLLLVGAVWLLVKLRK